MEKKNNGIVIILMGVIIVILAVLCILFATNTIAFNHKEIKNEVQNQENTSVKEDKETKEVSNNISIIFSEEKECENGCQKKVSTTSGEKILYVKSLFA